MSLYVEPVCYKATIQNREYFFQLPINCWIIQWAPANTSGYESLSFRDTTS